MSIDAPRLPSRPGPVDLVRGALILPRAAALVLRTPRLRALTLGCAAVTCAIFVGWAVGLWTLAPRLLDVVWPRPDGAPGLLWTLVAVLVGALAWLAGAMTLPLLALAPAQDLLVGATDDALGLPRPPGAGLARGIGQALAAVARTAARVVLLLAGQGLALLLQATVPVLAPLWIALGVGWTALWACAEYLDGPLSRGDRAWGRSTHVLRTRTWAALGFGLAVTGLLWIPLVNLFLVPVAAVGGALFQHALMAAGALPSREGGTGDRSPGLTSGPLA